MATKNRNNLCLCGSGKKYKMCCLNNLCPCGSGLKYKLCCINKICSCGSGKQYKFCCLNKAPPIKILVELKPSPVHGLGVFVTQNVPAFTKLCYYDGYDGINDYEDNTYIMAHPRKDGYVRYGYKANELKSKYGIAQLINDSCMPDLDLDQVYNMNQVKKICTEYEKKSTKNCNIGFCDPDNYFWIYSTRPIFKGEELFLNYGSAYWLSNKYRDLNVMKTYKIDFETKMLKEVTLNDL